MSLVKSAYMHCPRTCIYMFTLCPTETYAHFKVEEA